MVTAAHQTYWQAGISLLTTIGKQGCCMYLIKYYFTEPVIQERIQNTFSKSSPDVSCLP